MPFEFREIYVIYGFAAAAAIFVVEALYLVFASASGKRDRMNRRLKIMEDETDREAILLRLRNERGLTGDGDYRLPIPALNRLVLQSGLTIGFGRLTAIVVVVAVAAFAAAYILRDSALEAAGAAAFAALILPLMVLRSMRNRRRNRFGAQFPDAIDIITRSLKAGHPIPVAISLVAREMPDPIGTEFGLIADEVTYGSDLETALRDMQRRVGQEDLPLFVTAIAIQSATGGNLREILDNISAVIRQRFKMRRKVRAISAEGRFSALALSALPVMLFGIIMLVSPEFYGSVWEVPMTRIGLGLTVGWMLFGNIIMHKMVNFRI